MSLRAPSRTELPLPAMRSRRAASQSWLAMARVSSSTGWPKPSPAPNTRRALPSCSSIFQSLPPSLSFRQRRFSSLPTPPPVTTTVTAWPSAPTPMSRARMPVSGMLQVVRASSCFLPSGSASIAALLAANRGEPDRPSMSTWASRAASAGTRRSPVPPLLATEGGGVIGAGGASLATSGTTLGSAGVADLVAPSEVAAGSGLLHARPPVRPVRLAVRLAAIRRARGGRRMLGPGIPRIDFACKRGSRARSSPRAGGNSGGKRGALAAVCRLRAAPGLLTARVGGLGWPRGHVLADRSVSAARSGWR